MVDSNVLLNRIAVVGLIEVLDCNPNGDMDNGNRPRMYDENFGFITGVSIKRLIRNTAEVMGKTILMRKGTGFNEEIRKAGLESLKAPEGVEVEKVEGADGETVLQLEATPKGKGNKKKTPDKREEVLKVKEIIRELIHSFWDVKQFGLVTTGDIGKALGEAITGAWHVSTICPSTNPIEVLEYPITRCFASDDKDKGINQNIGRNAIVKRGFYKVVFNLNYRVALQQGYTLDDVQDFVDVLKNIFQDGTYGISKFGMNWVDLRIIQPSEGRDLWYSFGELRRMTEIDWNYEKGNWELPVPTNEKILIGAPKL
jgi:Cas7 group CRISPR-associated protein Csh2